MGSSSLNGNYLINLQRGYQLGVNFRERSFELKLDEDIFSRHLANEAFQEILGRPGTSAEMYQWGRAVKADFSEEQLAKIFFNASEYQNQKRSPEETVQRIYEFTLDRKGEPEGVKFWADRIRQGETINSVIEGFYNSPEFKEKEEKELQKIQTTALNLIRLITRFFSFS